MNAVLIAHRGEPVNLPENSLEGFRAVLEAGAHLLETDVQITVDGVPVLCHDPGLLKMTGHDLRVTETSWRDMRELPAGQAEQFGNHFPQVRIARLEDFVVLLGQWPQAQAFVEIKQESLDAFGVESVVYRVLEQLSPVHDQCVVISFNAEVVRLVKARIPSGWVLSEWSERSRVLAEQLEPDYLFVSRKRLPGEDKPLWPGRWQWAVYTVDEAAEVARQLSRGIQLVETNNIRSLLTTPDLSGTPNA
ncbi:MAG: glycerophosphodiester phosphodiesterase [Candidatus Thiodiazotropha sp. (ex Monitilora ramsayi)]|nr:glycerophosphodiester phosphodiesterase [Candidatus Thiodiazotropha sp. (ex Monitilora ramsayi)]